MAIQKYNPTDTIPASKQVSRIGKYLYNHLDGAYKFKTGSNEYDVFLTIAYTDESGNEDELSLDINLTTYQNKIRMNIIAMEPSERTIGFDVFKPEQVQNLEKAYKKILDKVDKRLCKAFPGYEFVLG